MARPAPGFERRRDATMSDELDRPLGAFVLSLIGGVLILAAGAVLAAAGSALGALGFGGGGVIAGLGALGAIFGFLIIILAIGCSLIPTSTSFRGSAS
ncbi:MAG TPA: hypothetical protein VEY07_03555 [Thermoplasmata archaeon]|nr:hypothetical protein [Thermoplasmata archaeon]